MPDRFPTSLRIDQIIRLPTHLPLLILLPIQRALPIRLPLTMIPRILIALPGLALARALVELIEDFLGDTVEEFFGVDAEEAPCQIDGFVDGAGFVGGLGDECFFELFEEFEGELVFG